MSSRSSSSGVSSFTRLPSAKQQQRFPNLKRSVRARSSLPKLSKSQSTLTQLDFATPSSAGNGDTEVISLSSEEELQERPPRTKKRKWTSKFDVRESDQSSMTQSQRGEIPAFTKRRKLSGGGGDGFEIWEDYDVEKWEAEIKDSQRRRLDAMPWLGGDDERLGRQKDDGEIPETSQARVGSSPRAGSGVDVKAQDRSAGFQTPKKVRFKKEVPSSQTPPSTRFSIDSSRCEEVIQRSPLKERSDNMQSSVSPRWSKALESREEEMLGRHKFGDQNKVQLANPVNSPSPERIKSSQGEVERAFVRSQTPSAPRLLATNTIQDSQAESDEPVLNKRTPQWRRINTVPDSQTDDVDALSLPKSNSLEHDQSDLERVTTIQNSQSEDLHLEPSSQTDGFETFDGLTHPTESQIYGLQSTYDPAYSALDRDAARFRWTQTQPPLDRVHELDEDSETDEEDLDTGCMPRPSDWNLAVVHDDDEVQSMPRRDLVGDKSLEAVDDQHVHDNGIQKSPIHSDGAHQLKGGSHRMGDETQIPSSPPPPPPHLSQVSTVMPTQWSPRPADQRMTSFDNRSMNVRSPSNKRSTQPFTTLDSSQKPFSSSPMPFPPWTSPGRREFAREELGLEGDEPEKNHDGMPQSLVDFSLPPPPPLSSARSGM